MSDEWQDYLKDHRTICKFGEKCYQKNPDHHTKYKHPPGTTKEKANTSKDPNKRFTPYSREAKKVGCGENAPRSKEPTNSNDRDNAELVGGTGNNDNDSATITSSDGQNHVVTIQSPGTLTFHDATIDQDKYMELFLVKMPPDFFKFFECLKEEGPDVEKTLSKVNLELVGPYDLIMGRLPVMNLKDLYYVHWRFFYDPPELQAVLKSKGKSEFHIGYYRDEPKACPVMLVSNDPSRDCKLTPIATDIFGAVYSYLKNQKKTPFTELLYKKMMSKVANWAEKYNYSIEEFDPKKRINNISAMTLHGAGIKVPFSKKTQVGYRRLVETNQNIRKLFVKIEGAKTEKEKDSYLSEFQPVITYSNIAVDEGDFGTGLEAGIAMFCSGLKELEPSALNSLCTAYKLLNREEFATIIEAHFQYRRKGCNLAMQNIVRDPSFGGTEITI